MRRILGLAAGRGPARLVLLGGTCHAVQHLWDADGVAHGERARAALDPARHGSAIPQANGQT